MSHFETAFLLIAAALNAAALTMVIAVRISHWKIRRWEGRLR